MADTDVTDIANCHQCACPSQSPAGGPTNVLARSRRTLQAQYRPSSSLRNRTEENRTTADDEALRREEQASDRPWLHSSHTGEPIGPAPISRDQVTGRLIVLWEEGQTIAYEGRAVLPQFGMKLFLGDLRSANDSQEICGHAPVTPPTARQQMITKARTQEEATRLTDSASASDLHGAGTPPGAFEVDEAVTQFATKWLYMPAGFGDPAWVCAHNTPEVAAALDVGPLRFVCSPLTPTIPKSIPQPQIPHPPTIVRYGPLTSKYSQSDSLACTQHRPARNWILDPSRSGTRSVCPLLWRGQLDIRRHRQGLFNLSVDRMYLHSNGSRVPSPTVPVFAMHRLCLHIPVLLRNRTFQTHPWTRQAKGRRRVPILRTGSWYASRAHQCYNSTALLLCADAYTGRSLLLAMQPILCRATQGWGRDSAPCSTSRLGPYFDAPFRTAFQVLGSKHMAQWNGHEVATAIITECCKLLRTPCTRLVCKRTVDATHTHLSRGAKHAHTQGPPGPKSGERSRQLPTRPTWPYRLMMWFMQIQISTGTLDARVVTSAQGVTGAGIDPSMEATREPAKPPLGTQATYMSRPRSSPRVHKHTYARALRRAHLNGGAWYRGKWIRPDPEVQTPPRTMRQHGRTKTPPQSSSRHYRVFSWNTGGLGGGLYDEVLLYLQRSEFDVMLLQETKWRFESMWEDNTHYFIHSGTNAKDHQQAGLLTVISKRIVDKGSLRFISAIDGRLMRVQFKHGPRQVDVINFYQHTWRPTKHVQSLRHKAWDSLTQQIQAVPLRSRLLIGGDFNTPCTASAPHAGPNVLPKPDHGIQDADDLLAIVQGLDLIFLNTFTPDVPAHTYQWNQQRSQIDFWLTRRLQAGGRAKSAGPMSDFHVGRWRGGPRHLPVQASLMYHWQPWEHRQFQHLTHQTEVDRHDILRACSAADDQRIPRFRADVQTLLTQGPLPIEQLQSSIFELACKHFPKRPPRRVEKPWQDGTLTHYAETMWGHFRARSALIRSSMGKPTLADSFRIWKHTMFFHRLHRAAQVRGKVLQKQKQTEMLETAKQAAERHDFREHYRLIQAMAPRATYRKFQLRLHGKLLTPEAELREMRTHFEKLYQADKAPPPAHIHLEDAVPVEPEEILESIQTLQASKAGLPGSSPGAIWRICGDQVAHLVASDLTQRWRKGIASVPTDWSVASLALILKPGKQGTLPTHYRPIGLIDALGKASISMLFRKIRHDLETYVLTSPQFAYVKGRSTQEALRRVYHHCSQAQVLRDQHARNVHHKRAGLKSAPLSGGIQACLDMSTAFDIMPRSGLREALHEAGVPESPARLLLHWIDSSVYRIRVEQHTTEVASSRGVKQGCPVSPLLFAAFSTMVTRKLDAKLGPSWSATHLTLYADDWHVSCLFDSYPAFDKFCQRLGVVFTTLEQHGMIVNADKASVILTMQGTLRKRAIAEFSRLLKDKRHLMIRASGRNAFLPIVSQAEYLGAVISYRNFRSLTLEHRICKCKATHQRLRKILQGRRGLTLSQRVLLWRSTVLPSALYGLGACGLTGTQMQRLHQVLLRHLRAKAPAHLTHESDSALLARLRIVEPALALHAQHARLIAADNPHDPFVQSHAHPWKQELTTVWNTLLASGSAAHPTPLHAPQLHTPSLLPDSIEQVTQTTTPAPHHPQQPATVTCADSTLPDSTHPSPKNPTPTSFQCPHCCKSYPLLSTLRWHMKKVHQLHMPRTQFDRAKHSVDGMPICAMCGASFTRWEVLEAHVTHQRCTNALPTQTVTPQTLQAATPVSSVPSANPDHTGHSAASTPLTELVPRSPSGTHIPHETVESHTQKSAVLTQATATGAPGQEPTMTSAMPSEPSYYTPPAESMLLVPGEPRAFRDFATTVIRNKGLAALLRSSLMPKLASHCLICGQWVAAARTIKIHYQRFHPNLTPLEAQATQLAKRVGGAFSPCLYCERPHTHPRQHLATCIPLFQACSLALLCNHGTTGGRPGHDGDVWAPPGEKGQPSRGPGEDDGGRAPEQVRKAERGRKGQGTQQAAARTLQGWWQKLSTGRPGGRDQPGRAQTGSESPCPSTGGHRHVTIEHRVDLVATHPGANRDPHIDRGGGAVARAGGQEGQQAQGHAAQAGHVLEPDAVCLQYDGEAVRGERHLGEELGVDRQQQPLGVSALESRGESVGSRQQPTGTPTRGAPPDHQGDPVFDPSGDALSIPCASAARAADAGPNSASHDGYCTTKPRGDAAVSVPFQPTGECITTARGTAVQTLDHAASATHQADPGLRVSLRSLTLANPGNWCYVNSAVRALLWAHVSEATSSQDVDSERGFTAAGAQAVRSLHGALATPQFLPGTLPWRFMLSGWASAQDQHDCAEFLHHLCRALCPQAMNGDWCARRLEGAHVQQTEEAGCSQAISLELPPGEQLSTQFLIHCWHTQHAIHALRHPPLLLMLQFSRYSFGPTGAHKNHVRIQWPRTLNIPLFVDAGLDSCNITYTVEAAILHRGERLTSGHYTTLLHAEGETVYCDDGHMPQPLAANTSLVVGSQFCSREVYMLLCRRGETPTH